MFPCARGHTKLATCARASWARRRTWPHSHYLMRQCIGVGGWDSELLTRVQQVQVQVQNRWAMMPLWAENHLSYPPPLWSSYSAFLARSSISHPSPIHPQSCISHASVMHNSSIRSDPVLCSAFAQLSDPHKCKLVGH